MTRDEEQLSLFAPPESPRAAELAVLAARIPENVRFGTSSWTYPEWKGIVYFDTYPNERAFNTRSLAEYARYPILRTVGIDRTYYAPIPDDELAHHAAQVPHDFRPVAKVWCDVAAPWFPRQPRYGARAGERNVRFLDPSLFEESMGAAFTRAFGARRVPFVLEIPPSPIELVPFTRRLERFLGALADAHAFAVELRNVSLLAPRYFDVLRAYGATHVLNQWERMPEIDAQLARAMPLHGGITVIRLLMPVGMKYDDLKQALAPFNRISSPQPRIRDLCVHAIRTAMAAGNEVFVVSSNKVEGCAALTVEAIARQLVAT